MVYEELAVRLLEITRPRGKRPPLDHMKEQERGGDILLRYLYDSGGSATPRGLAEAFEVSSARITILLGMLEREGFLLRACDPRDRRRIIITITPEGEDHILRKETEIRRNVAAILERLGEKDARQMVRLAARLVEIAGEGGCFPAQEKEHRKGHGNG